MKYVRIRCLDFHSIEMMRFKTIIYTLTEVSKGKSRNANVVKFLSFFIGMHFHSEKNTLRAITIVVMKKLLIDSRFVLHAHNIKKFV